MYKLLPLLLFAVVFSQSQDKKDLFLQDDPKVLAFKMLLSDMNDTAYVPTDYNSYIDYLKQVKENEINIKVNGLLGGNMFSFKTNFEIIDTAFCNEKSECIPNKFSNIVVDEFNILKVATNYSAIKLEGSKCEYDYTEYGTESCDTAWDEHGINCSRLEGDYNWDCSGCNCTGDKDKDERYAWSDMPDCFLICPGFENLSENSEIAEVCNWFNTSWVENECLNGCENDTELLSYLTGKLIEMCDCPSQTWDEDDNCIYVTLSLDRPFHKKSNQNCPSCEHDFENYGSECCDTAWDEYKINCVELETNYHWDCSGCNCPGDSYGDECVAGYVDDCSGDGDCCPESWIGDGFKDCSHQPYGCDLSCYNNDYGDCHFLKPKIENDYFNKGLSIELIYNEVVNKDPSTPIYNSVNSQTKYGIITGKLKVNVYHDKNVRLASYKSNVINLIISTHPSLPHCDDCISFTNIDMDSLRSVNKKGKSTISLNRDDIYDDSWAVIIGIDKYKYSNQLNYAVKDAEAVKDMLINKFDFPEENIRYLVNDEATLSNIKLNLGEVATSAEENDRILVFYSGHGETLIGADNSEKGYIIPFEGKQDNPYATGIAMDEILTTSQMSKSKHMLFLMDACYSGLMTEHVKGLSKPKEDGYLSKVANEKARQIITAGGNEPAIEGGRWNHSVFTKNLLEGLDDWAADTDSDGYITADELGTYLRKSVTEDSNNQQTPQKGRFINSGGGEFVFFSNSPIAIPSFNVDEEDEIIYGCMDENANNYNPNATKPDRSCQYGKVITVLEFGEFESSNNILPIVISNNEPVSTVSFNVLGVEIIDLFGGIVEENKFLNNYLQFDFDLNRLMGGDVEYRKVKEDNMMDLTELEYNNLKDAELEHRKNRGKSIFIGFIEPGKEVRIGNKQTLCYLKIELLDGYSIEDICLENIIMANNKNQDIKNIYNSSLTCYGD